MGTKFFFFETSLRGEGSERTRKVKAHFPGERGNRKKNESWEDLLDPGIIGFKGTSSPPSCMYLLFLYHPK